MLILRLRNEDSRHAYLDSCCFSHCDEHDRDDIEPSDTENYLGFTTDCPKCNGREDDIKPIGQGPLSVDHSSYVTGIQAAKASSFHVIYDVTCLTRKWLIYELLMFSTTHAIRKNSTSVITWRLLATFLLAFVATLKVLISNKRFQKMAQSSDTSVSQTLELMALYWCSRLRLVEILCGNHADKRTTASRASFN